MTKFVIVINGLIIKFRLPKDGPKLRLWRHFKFVIFSPTSKAHFNISFLILLVMINCYKTNKCTELFHDEIKICEVMPKSSFKCPFLQFLEVIFTCIFCPDNKCWIFNFLWTSVHINVDDKTPEPVLRLHIKNFTTYQSWSKRASLRYLLIISRQQVTTWYDRSTCTGAQQSLLLTT